MSLQEANLRALYARHPQLADKALESRYPREDFRLSVSRSGQPTAMLGGAYLHSRYDPLREARRLAHARIAGASPSALIFYGFGLGYLVEAYAELCPDTPMVVVEADPGSFAAALRERDLRGLLGAANLRWHLGDGPESVLMSIDSLALGAAQVTRLPAAVEADREYYRRLDALLQSLLDKREVNSNTLQRFGRLWVRNLLSNLERFVSHPGIEELRGVFPDMPALVLAAGPSLEQLLPHLGQLRDRMLIVAVDTSHRFCLQQGFEPDLLVSVDPQYWNTRHLDWLPLRDSILICESAVNPRLFHRLPDEPLAAYFVSSFFPLGQLLERTIGARGSVGAGGSVSTTAWDVARHVGASPVYLGGLDLGFPGGRTHARGAFFEERLHALSGRLAPVEQGTLAYLCEAGPVRMPSNDAGLVLTDRRMLIYRAWFEDQFKQQAAAGGLTRSFSLSAQGLRVAGLPTAGIRECLRLPVIRRSLRSRLQAARRRALARPPGAEARERLRRTLLGLGEELQVVHSLARRGEAICSGMLASARTTGDPGLLEELDRIDGGILEVSSRQVAAFLLQPLIGRILDCPRRPEDFREVLTVSRDLYSQMAASTRYHGELLKSSLQRLIG